MGVIYLLFVFFGVISYDGVKIFVKNVSFCITLKKKKFKFVYISLLFARNLKSFLKQLTTAKWILKFLK